LVPVFDDLALFDSSTASAFFLFLPNSILLYLQKQWAANNADDIYNRNAGELQVSSFLGHHEFLPFKFSFSSGTTFRRLLLLRLDR
jgi:hypothetical protein